MNSTRKSKTPPQPAPLPSASTPEKSAEKSAPPSPPKRSKEKPTPPSSSTGNGSKSTSASNSTNSPPIARAREKSGVTKAVTPKRKNRPRQRPPGLTVAEVVGALRSAAGIRSLAAQILKVDRSTITHFIKRHPAIEDVEAEIRNELLDLSEGKLVEKIRDGDTGSIRYYLDTHGAERGYGRKVTLKTDPDNPLRLTNEPTREDYSKLSREERRELMRMRQKMNGAQEEDRSD